MAERNDLKNPPGSVPPPGQKGSKPPSRVLLLGLLLVVLGGAAYFYAMEMTAPQPVPVPAAVTKQLITPAPPAESGAPVADPAAAAKPAQAPATAGEGADQKGRQPVAVPAEPAAPVPPSPSAQESPKLVEKGVLTEVPAAAPPVPAAAPAAAGVAQKDAPSPAAEPPPAVAAAPPAAQNLVPAPTVVKPKRGAYTLLAGAYISPATLNAAKAKVRALGHQPRTFQDAKLVEMTRVRLGTFAPGDAQAKLAQIKPLAPDAFTLPEGEQVAVYASSHFSAAAHQAFAARLQQAGVAFEEEKVMRKLPISELSFGEFPDRASAEAAAAKARKAGLEIVVLKRP